MEIVLQQRDVCIHSELDVNWMQCDLLRIKRQLCCLVISNQRMHRERQPIGCEAKTATKSSSHYRYSTWCTFMDPGVGAADPELSIEQGARTIHSNYTWYHWTMCVRKQSKSEVDEWWSWSLGCPGQRPDHQIIRSHQIHLFLGLHQALYMASHHQVVLFIWSKGLDSSISLSQ